MIERQLIGTKEIIEILDAHYRKSGFTVRNILTANQNYFSELEISLEKLQDFQMTYQLDKLEITDHLWKKIVTIPPQTRSNVFDFSSLKKEHCEAIIKNHILNQLSEKEQKIVIEIYTLCPETISKGSSKNQYGKVTVRAVQSNLKKAFSKTESRELVPIHRKIINDLRIVLHEFQKK